MANIYIVEDDTNIQEIEAIALKNSGHSVEPVSYTHLINLHSRYRSKDSKQCIFIRKITAVA